RSANGQRGSLDQPGRASIVSLVRRAGRVRAAHHAGGDGPQRRLFPSAGVGGVWPAPQRGRSSGSAALCLLTQGWTRSRAPRRSASAKGGRMMHSYGLLHVNINVSDLARSVRFYTEALGFVVVCESTETVDFGSGPETISQVILTIPKTRTILALTHAP